MILGIDVQPTRLGIARLDHHGVVHHTSCPSIRTDPPKAIRAAILTASTRRGPVCDGFCVEPTIIRAEQPFIPKIMGQRNVLMLGAVMARVEDACRALWPWAIFEWVSPRAIYTGIGGTGRMPKRDDLKALYGEFARRLIGPTNIDITQDELDAVCIAWGAVREGDAA